MQTSSEYLWGVLIGFLVSFGIVYLLITVLRKRRGGHGQYDERQTLVQGRAYKASLFTLLFYLLAVGLFDLFTGIRWCSLFVCVMIGICLSIGVYAMICIVNDAYISVREKPRFTLLLLTVVSVMNLVPGIANLLHPGYLLTGGILNEHITNLLVGVLLLALAIGLLLRILRSKREESL